MWWLEGASGRSWNKNHSFLAVSSFHPLYILTIKANLIVQLIIGIHLQSVLREVVEYIEEDVYIKLF